MAPAASRPATPPMADAAATVPAERARLAVANSSAPYTASTGVLA